MVILYNGTLLARYTHKLDALGNWVKLTEMDGPAGSARTVPTDTLQTRVITYTYDDLNRLLAATYSTGETFTYVYDAIGNRSVMTDAAGRHTYTYDAANRGYRLTNVDGITYTADTEHPADKKHPLDARGNLIHDGVYTYTYDTAGRMVRAESLTATLVYTYTSAALSASNGDGLLVTQGTSATVSTFTWDLALRLPQVLGTSDSRHLYGYGRIGVRQDDTWHYPLPDALGSARQWTDGTGSLDYAAGYTPFGEPMWQQGSAPAPWGYTGEHWNANVGLLYLRARWYDPTVGRFTQRDLFPGFGESPRTQHDYVYGLNNPVRFTDPSGNLATILPVVGIGAALGALASGGLYVATTQEVKPLELTLVMGTGAVAGALIGTGVGAMAGLKLAGSVGGAMSLHAAGIHAAAGTGMLGAGIANLLDSRNEGFNPTEYTISVCARGIEGALIAAIQGRGLWPTAIARGGTSGMIGSVEYGLSEVAQGRRPTVSDAWDALGWSAIGGLISDIAGQWLFAVAGASSTILDERLLNRVDPRLMGKALTIEIIIAIRELIREVLNEKIFQPW
jgi:RHS repeat-associated protein